VQPVRGEGVYLYDADGTRYTDFTSGIGVTIPGIVTCKHHTKTQRHGDTKIMMDDTLHFRMERFDDEDGIYYVITGVEELIVTDGETLKEALDHLQEAIEVHFSGEERPQNIVIESTLETMYSYA
jgi:predicted RNase H-like HicB family nuclease